MIKLAALFVLAAAMLFSARADASEPVALSAPALTLPALPPNWPATLELGSASAVGDGAALKKSAPFGFRYRYLAGGVNTGETWANWKRSIVWHSSWPPGLSEGAYVPTYIKESQANGQIPVFTYYEIRQSKPGASWKGESDGDYENLQNKETMTAYWQDITRFFQQAGATGATTVLHVEPDLWGYMEQRAKNEDPSTVSAQVAATGISDLDGLPDTMQGFARAVVRLRDKYAPNVLLAYHLSVWGTGTSDHHDSQSGCKRRAARPPDRDLLQGTRRRLRPRLRRVLRPRRRLLPERRQGQGRVLVGRQRLRPQRPLHLDLRPGLRQARRHVADPLGNTKMRAMDNTTGHYQDNRVEWLLDDPSGDHLRAYRDAGVIAFLFGGGATGTTCACDALKDGVTNPKPINGNNQDSYSADDDGGFFMRQAAQYYTNGPLRLDSEAGAAAQGPSGLG